MRDAEVVVRAAELHQLRRIAQRGRSEVDEAVRELETFGVDGFFASEQKDERSEQAAAARHCPHMRVHELPIARAQDVLLQLCADCLGLRAPPIERGRRPFRRGNVCFAIDIDTKDDSRIRAREFEGCVREEREDVLVRSAVGDELAETEKYARGAVLHDAEILTTRSRRAMPMGPGCFPEAADRSLAFLP